MSKLDWHIDRIHNLSMALNEANDLWDAQALGSVEKGRSRRIVQLLRWVSERADKIAEEVASAEDV